jgi:hypothetical protein
MTDEQLNAIRELLGPKSYRSLVRRCKAVKSQKEGGRMK